MTIHLTFFQEYGLDLTSSESFVIPGILCGVLGSLLVGPAEHMRIRMQIQGTQELKVYTGSMDAGVKIFKKYGLRGVYQGLLATIVREMGFCAGFFSFYEMTKRQFRDTPNAPLSSFETFIAGGITGILTWSLIFPADTLKSIAQTDALAPSRQKYNGYFNMVRKVVKENGVRHLYRGLDVCLMRAFPVNAVTFSFYEIARSSIDKLRNVDKEDDTDLLV